MGVKAKVVNGFFRGGQPVERGAVLDLPDLEFYELQMFNLVERAPAEEPKPKDKGK